MTPSRIAERFARLRREGRKAFVGFITAGDPSLEGTVDAALALEAGGVDVLELGVPFSDPLADGPVIQRASERALRRGVTLERRAGGGRGRSGAAASCRCCSSATTTRCCATASTAWPTTRGAPAWTACW